MPALRPHPLQMMLLSPPKRFSKILRAQMSQNDEIIPPCKKVLHQRVMKFFVLARFPNAADYFASPMNDCM